jgi:hypothetical protein
MARRWSGFLPQNQDIKEQWGIMEDTQAQVSVGLSPGEHDGSDTLEPEDESLEIRVLKPA